MYSFIVTLPSRVLQPIMKCSFMTGKVTLVGCQMVTLHNHVQLFCVLQDHVLQLPHSCKVCMGTSFPHELHFCVGQGYFLFFFNLKYISVLMIVYNTKYNSRLSGSARKTRLDRETIKPLVSSLIVVVE